MAKIALFHIPPNSQRPGHAQPPPKGSTVALRLNLEQATARFPRTHFLPSLEVENMPKNGKNSPFSHSPEFTATWACPTTAQRLHGGPPTKSRAGHRQISQNALFAFTRGRKYA